MMKYRSASSRHRATATMLQEFFRCTGAKPSFRTRIRAGRELTVYSVPPRSAGFRHTHYWVRNGQVVEIETTGTR